ncbi:hypothetical protein GCM10007301_18470 [Azorhizobium oxalatiphilum]|uniref:Uncharacterized protein n=1 Tax=Azorhizobium oxalatiphilum TaxID=980631 RepID=A0A917BU98_9HYPH|nr:bifunctional alpha/beta hydrolase/class I SAM-dependent methyltransferase [Azorhizobium oxalatiphilum]GGF59076.1 hypothetical protein GCM10007301_18470 [Azorhizobium oxalatiphilum]
MSADTTSARRIATQAEFAAPDGSPLFYRYWTRPEGTSGNPRGAIVLLHRGHEHSGRMMHLVEELGLDDFEFYAWDARGHGQSAPKGPAATGFDDHVRDLDAFIRHINAAHGIAISDTALVAQSVGAAIAATWVHDFAPRIRCMTLASPAFDIRLYVPFARPGLKLLRSLMGPFPVKSYVTGRQLTRDPVRQRTYGTDPLIVRPINVDVLLGLYEAAERVVADARAINTPTQLLISGSDYVVQQDVQHRFFERLATGDKERHVLPGFLHDTLGEAHRTDVVRMVRDFILKRFAAPATRPALLDAHRVGYTRDEMEELASPQSLLSPRGAYWALTRLSLKIGGLFSEGIALGHRTGFDSGSTLDYIYRNEAAGRGWLGRRMDRTYLDAPGWQGIRQRKVHAQALIRHAMERLAGEGRDIRLMDIAAGHGRYVLEAVAGAPQRPSSILLRDYSDINVEAGTRLAASLELDDITTFMQGDAFDGDNLAAVAPKVSLAVVSGLYELFPDNALIRRSLAGVAAATEDGGYLVYTGQPWHPQLEMIARTLTSHRAGEPWIMRRRTQEEMDQLVAAAGFEKIEQRIDRWGIFTVSLARKVAP